MAPASFCPVADVRSASKQTAPLTLRFLSVSASSFELHSWMPWPLLPYPPPEGFAGSIEGLMVKGRQARKRRKNIQSHSNV